MRLEVTPHQISSTDGSDTAVTSGYSKLTAKVSHNIASPTSSLNIKVPDGNKKTTPPKSSPKRRRRRVGDEYHHPDEDGVDDKKSAADGSSSGSKDSRYRVSSNRRVKRDYSSENTGSYKTTGTGGRGKSTTSAKTLSNSLRTEDIPVGQWIVLIGLLAGIVGYVRHCSKNSSSEKQSAAWKKKEKKKSIIRNHSTTNSRRKGKGHSNHVTTSKANSKQNVIKTNNTEDSEQNDVDKSAEVEKQQPDEPTVNEPSIDQPVVDQPPIDEPILEKSPSIEPPAETKTEVKQEFQTETTRKKKKRVKKKPVQTSIPVVEDVLIPSKSSPDSVSTDGSSSANISHQDHHSVNEEDFNHSYEYEDYAEFEVIRPEEEWTTVVPRGSLKTQSSDKSEKHEEAVHIESSVSSKVSQSHGDAVVSDKGSNSVVIEGTTVTEMSSYVLNATEDTNASEEKTETSYESDVTPQTNNHTINKTESNENDDDNNNESPIEEEDLNIITQQHAGDNNGRTNTKTGTHSFSQADDEALARMLQREEEEMAAATVIGYDVAVVSPKGPEVDNVWEEVKKRRASKKQTTDIMEEQ